MKINNFNFYKKKFSIYANETSKSEYYFDIIFNIINKIKDQKYDKNYIYSLIFKDIIIITEFINILKFYEKEKLFTKNYIDIPFSSNDLEEMMFNNTLISSVYNLKILLNEKKNCKIKIYKKKNNEIYQGKKNFYQKIFFFLEKLFSRNKKVYFDFINFKLYLKSLFNGYIPIFFDQYRLSDKIDFINEYDHLFRKRIINEIKKQNLTEDDFFKLEIIIFLLPITKIESFENLSNFYEKLPYNKNDIIMLSYTRYSDKSNFWLAKKLMITSKSFYYQYGSGIGTGLSHNHIEYNFKFFNYLLTWNSKKKIKNKFNQQIPCFYLFQKKPVKKYDILIVNTDNPYYFKNNNGPVFLQVKKVLKDQIELLNNIPTKFKTIVKNPDYKYNYANIEKTYLTFNHFEKIKKNKIQNLVAESKLVINTYYGTTLFQMMANDIPNILIIRKSHYKFNEEFNDYLAKLKKHNFIFYNSKNATKFLKENFNYYLKYWDTDKDFIKLREEFKDKFCPKNLDWQNSVAIKIFKKQN